ncbi:MAG: methyltransferase [Thermoguttaceae bacterium]
MREDRDSSRLALGEMAMGFFRGKALCAAVRLGIADALAVGPMTAEELAAATMTSPDALRRFMRALGSLGVVEEISPARFELAKFGDPLRRDAPGSVWASMIFWADLLADAWTYLPDCVRAGDRSGAEVARQRDGATSRWSTEPEAQAIFHAVFAEATADDFAPFVQAWDFSRCQVIADLGGGGGGLLAAVLAAQPLAKGVLVERQAAIDGASRRFEIAGFAGRCECLAGDLLESVPSGPDVYLMRCVLHGYDDESALQILRNVRQAMAPESQLLLIEVVLPNRVDRPSPEIEKLFMSDLNMLVATGGRERNESEWNALLASAGLIQRRILPVPGHAASIIEAACSD